MSDINHIETMERKMSNLEKYLAEYTDLAPQGSDAWLEERRFVIGGSEIATVLGKNKYSSIPKLVAQKIGLSKFHGNTATRWGHLFEKVTEMCFRTIFLEGREIYGAGSIPNKKIPAHRYSPDGLCIMRVGKEYKLVLLEFKAPLCSIPGGQIPPHYVPQILAGLATIEVAECGIFINNMYRRCALADLNFGPKYDLQFHRDANKKISIDSALGCGIILFHIPGGKIDAFLTEFLEERKALPKCEFAADELESVQIETSDDSDEGTAPPATLLQRVYQNLSLFLASKLSSKKYSLLDLGEVCTQYLGDWLELYDKGIFAAQYINANFNIEGISENENLYISEDISYARDKIYLKGACKKFNFEKTMANYKKICLHRGDVPVGVLPWKLIKSDILTIKKDPDFLMRNEKKINEVVAIVREISARPDECGRLYNQHFPDNPINDGDLTMDEINEIVNFGR